MKLPRGSYMKKLYKNSRCLSGGEAIGMKAKVTVEGADELGKKLEELSQLIKAAISITEEIAALNIEVKLET